jgi:hypothetical protein
MMTVLAPLLLAFAADVKVDNDAVRIVSIFQEVGQERLNSTQRPNYVIVCLSDGEETEFFGGTLMMTKHWKAGEVLWAQIKAEARETISRNTGSTPLRFIEIELKRAVRPQPARDPKLDPVAIDPTHNILLFENPQVRVFRSKREPGGTEMMHQHTGAGRVGVFFTPLSAIERLADGSARPVPKLSAGELKWSEGPTIHATTNLGPDAMDMIVIEVK